MLFGYPFSCPKPPGTGERQLRFWPTSTQGPPPAQRDETWYHLGRCTSLFRARGIVLMKAVHTLPASAFMRFSVPRSPVSADNSIDENFRSDHTRN